MNTEDSSSIYRVAYEYGEELRAGFRESTGKEMPVRDAVVAHSYVVDFLYWLLEKERKVKEQKKKDEQTTTVD